MGRKSIGLTWLALHLFSSAGKIPFIPGDLKGWNDFVVKKNHHSNVI